MKMDKHDKAMADPVALRGTRRDSMFLKATIDVERVNASFDIVVRNVSAGGMLADSTVTLEMGDAVQVDLRRVGKVPGRVVWVQPGRFGVAFDVSIDPQRVRQPVTVKKTSAPKASQFEPPRRRSPGQIL